jgi:hypothetical protein
MVMGLYQSDYKSGRSERGRTRVEREYPAQFGESIDWPRGAAGNGSRESKGIS